MDREKVIKAIDICLGHGKCDDCGYRIKGGYSTMDCRKPMMRDALALLKEQEEKYNKLAELSEGHIVFCKDCKFGEACKNGAGEHGVMCYNSQSASHSWVHEPDWFCADGERRDDL